MNNLNAIREFVIPFFKRFGFLSAKKKRDFAKFCELAVLLQLGQHGTQEGIERILCIRRDMNDGGKRRYSDQHILQCFHMKESSETLRRTHANEMIKSELSSDGESSAEMPEPLPTWQE